MLSAVSFLRVRALQVESRRLINPARSVSEITARPVTSSIARNPSLQRLSCIAVPLSCHRALQPQLLKNRPFFSAHNSLALFSTSTQGKSGDSGGSDQGGSSSFSSATHSESESRGRRLVALWLLACAGMCFSMVIIGGLTRLTESGLSITEWKPFRGAVPPTTPEEWEAEFEKYKQSPEYHKLNFGMTLQEFKRIYLMEWFHREWGRITGLVFALPFALFLTKGMIPKTDLPKYLGLLGLGGAQGLIGWIMVKSGLDHATFKESGSVPRVNQYKLAMHFSTAVALYSSLLWMSLNRFYPKPFGPFFPTTQLFRRLAMGTVGLAFLTSFSGAFVAGLDAGLIYNTFPLMGGQWIPEDILPLVPVWKNFFENDTTVQFDHRVLGTSTLASIVALYAASRSRKVRLPPQGRLALNLLLGMGSLQVGLGITTLLTFVPIPIAATHQAGAMTLMSISIWLLHVLKRIPK